MRLLNEVRTVTVAQDVDGRPVQAEVRLRGIDARGGPMGVVFERYVPEAVIVGDRLDARRIPIPAERTPNALLMLAIPLGALLVSRLARRKG